MMKRGEAVLVTGGGGFIGRHLCKALLAEECTVRVLDAFIDQVHGNAARDPVFDHAEVITGDIRDQDAVRGALRGIDSVVHLAAEVGVGQSMYEIDRYVSVNDHGTAVLLNALLEHPVRRLVVASSMSIYGEGLYQGPDGFVEDAVRTQGQWNPVGPGGAALTPVPTPEWKRPVLASVYAITKYTQEQLCLNVARAYDMEAVALRLFNVFGLGQSLNNPYTGVLAIFASRILNGEKPMIFEDGLQRRDFVHVEDVADAFTLALSVPEAAGKTLNIGSGISVNVQEVAQILARVMGREDLQPEILQKARVGDIRNCFADIGLAREVLGFAPKRTLADSLPELAQALAKERAVDHVERARNELETRGLVV
jgi:dTDP-L-rhamnose 4-epimerase